VGYKVTFAAQADRDLGTVVRLLALKNLLQQRGWEMH